MHRLTQIYAQIDVPSQPKLSQILSDIRLKKYCTLIVYSMDRFSRQSPSKINALLDKIVEEYKCRFIALQQSIDSESEMNWHVVKPLFTYFANKYSKDLGDKVRKGIARKKENGKYKGGRPRKMVNVDEIKHLRQAGLSYRAIADELRKFGHRVSHVTVKNVLNKPSSKSLCENLRK